MADGRIGRVQASRAGPVIEVDVEGAGAAYHQAGRALTDEAKVVRGKVIVAAEAGSIVDCP